jgi:arginyl-tRNA synthetase
VKLSGSELNVNMSNPLAELREECHRLLKEAADEAYPRVVLLRSKYSRPPNPEMGELSSAICFQMAREVMQRPVDIAVKIVEHINVGSSDLVDSVEAVNGYINFNIDAGKFSRKVLETVLSEDDAYGFIHDDNPRKVMVEHTSANPNSPLHIGNARNSIVGDCLAKLFEHRGHKVLRHFLVNDMGRQVAMTAYGWKLLGKPKPKKPAELWVGTIYASVNVINESNRLKKEIKEVENRGSVYEIAELQEELERYDTAAEELKKRFEDVFESLEGVLSGIDDPTSEIVKLNTAYENNESTTVEEVRQLVGYCLEGFEASLGEIGITFDSFDHESDLVWARKAEEVLEKLKATPYVFEDEGAVILDCDSIAVDMDLKERWGLNPQHEIPRLVLVRSDGTTLYTLRDMAYSIWKFGRAEKVINVIGFEQTLAQLQLRLALAVMGMLDMGDNQAHYAYEHVKFPGIKMSGRLGRYVTLLEVVERAVELAYAEVDVRTPHLSQEQKTEIAKMVGHGAVKYTMLSVDPMKTVTFDWEKALNFETNSAPFIQYGHARACNILKRIEKKPQPDYSSLVHVKEREIVMTLASFPDVFKKAVEGLKPGDVTAYANMLADQFNSFYAALPVLNAESEGLVGARLKLVNAVRTTIRNTLLLLGIEAPERM